VLLQWKGWKNFDFFTEMEAFGRVKVKVIERKKEWH
jgi:hypothetical protein